MLQLDFLVKISFCEPIYSTTFDSQDMNVNYFFLQVRRYENSLIDYGLPRKKISNQKELHI